MQVSHPNSMFLLFAVFCYLPSYIAGVAVKYSREPFTKAEGASLSLTCMVQFGKKACKEIQSKWCLLLTPDNCKPLIDPHRYIIHVNETEDREYRLRRIFITFNSLNLQDSGYYQCNAKCESGTEAKGHLVHLAVTEHSGVVKMHRFVKGARRAYPLLMRLMISGLGGCALRSDEMRIGVRDAPHGVYAWRTRRRQYHQHGEPSSETPCLIRGAIKYPYSEAHQVSDALSGFVTFVLKLRSVIYRGNSMQRKSESASAPWHLQVHMRTGIDISFDVYSKRTNRF
ncbi:hypothetical protein IRJ41_006474 [Triplophysa rosa]|uniref:Ig-like domain-containing protein n=1 Tax=Triplophysa rosa TaxID=992332 RepID=A0A9W8C8E6_TRIRA|nr:hypothetical protein IRJ41_006474 [Triplophysa rosa]